MDWQAILKSLAPTVASAFLGPLGGVAVAAVGNLLGISEATQDKIASVIQGSSLTPEQIGELKKLELQYQAEEKERGFRYSELEFKDRDSARIRDTEFVRQGTHNYRADILAYGALIAFCVSGYALFTMNLPDANRELIVYLLGALTVIVKDLYGFEFGSSKQQENQTRMLANQKEITNGN